MASLHPESGAAGLLNGEKRIECWGTTSKKCAVISLPLEFVAETQANSRQEIPRMKREFAVALSIATAAITLLIAQFASAQAAPSNDTPCAPQAAPVNDPGKDYVYWFDLYIPCAAVQQAAPSNTTSSAAKQNATSSAAMQQAMEMVPAQASLAQSIDASKVKQGDLIKATLSDRVQLKNGPELPSGTELIGQVTVDQMQNDGTYRLALVFTNAQLKNGTAVPIKATIMRVYPPVGYHPVGDALYYAYANTHYWTDRTVQVDQPDALKGVALQSRIAGDNSGAFVSKQKDEIRLSTDTLLDLAIAAQGKS